MDPTANLEEQLSIVARMSCGDGSEQDRDRLCELILALHEWMAAGGFLPRPWRRPHEVFRKTIERLVEP